MYLIKIITLLMPMVEMISSARYYPHALVPGETRISLSPNMFKKTKETKQDMENYLHDNAPFRKNNRVGFEKPKKTRDDLQQYLYEKYNDFRKSHNPTKQATEELKYLYDNAPYRKSLQWLRYLPVVGIKLKNNEQSKKKKVKPPNHENVGRSNFELLSILNKLSQKNKNKDKRYKRKKVEHDNVGRSYFELSDDDHDDKQPINLKIGTYLKQEIEDANKEVLRLGAEGKLQCVAVKTRKRHYYRTSSSSSKEFHSGEKRLFKLWQKHYVCGDAVMPKYVPEPDELALRPTNYNGTNRLLNEFLQEKIWRPGSPVKKKQPPPPVPKRLLSPLTRKTDGDNKYLMPPRTEFEFSELLM